MKTVILTGLVTLIAVVGYSGIAVGQTSTSTWRTSYNYSHEKTAINKDLASINQQQEKVKALAKQAKEERKAGVKTCSTRTELAKANADLQRQKDYLKADKAELVAKQQADISRREKTIRSERAALLSAQMKVQPALMKGKTDAVQKTQAIVDTKYQLRQNEAALKQVKTERNNDLLALNKQIKSANGESAFTLAFENGLARTQNLAMK